MTSVSCRTEAESPKLSVGTGTGTMPGFSQPRQDASRNRSGVRPTHCDHLFSRADGQPTKCGGETPHFRSTSRVSPFWNPLGHPALGAQLSTKIAKHATLLERIPQMQDLRKLRPCVTTQEAEGASNNCCCTSQSDEVGQMALQFAER